MSMGQALHQRLCELDEAGAAYTVIIPGVITKHCGVYDHSPNHLLVREYDERGHFVDHFINLATCDAVELEADEVPA